MKLIITEDKLYKTFTNFMDNYFGLTYHIVKKKYFDVDANEYVFTTKDGDSFGRAFENKSFICYSDKRDMIKSFFGNNTDELLLQYLNDKFGDFDNIKIRRIS
jgi:hypothetical protein